MIRQVEDTVTTEVAQRLVRITHGWTIETQQKPFDDKAHQPDIMAKRRGRETVAIEAKSYDEKIGDGETQLRTRFEHWLNPDWQ